MLVIVHNTHCEIKEVDNQGSGDLSRKNCEINTDRICEISGDVKIVYDLIRADVKLSQPEISKRVSFSARKVFTIIKVLKDSGYIKRVGSNKTGHWEVLK